MFFFDRFGQDYYLIAPLTGFFVFVVLAILALLRGGRSRTNRLFAGICILGGLINLDVAIISAIPDERVALAVDRLTYLFFVFSIPIYIKFVHSYLSINRRWIDLTAYASSIFLLIFTQTDFFISGINIYSWGRIARAGPLYYIFVMAGSFAVIYCLIILFIAAKRAKRSQKRNRIKYVIAGLGASTFLILLNAIPVSGMPFYPPGNFSFIPAIVLAFGVLKYDLLDLDSVIWKGAVYGALTIIMSAVYVLILYLFNLCFIKLTSNHPFILPLILSLMIVFLFDPLRRGIQSLFDTLFLRGKYDYRNTLKRTSGTLTSILKIDEIAEFLLESTYSDLGVRNVSLLLINEIEMKLTLFRAKGAHFPKISIEPAHYVHTVTEYFRIFSDPATREQIRVKNTEYSLKKRMMSFCDETESALLVPLIFKNALKGLLMLGEKRSGELFVPEDIELLSTIANQAAIAIENASSYEKIEKINVTLEKKVEERTADLREVLVQKERTQKQLIVSESLAAIGQLVAGTAHELNNPLASASSLIESSLETIADVAPKYEKHSEIVEDLKFSLNELNRAAHIVRSLLSLSRQTHTYVESVDVNEVLEDALRVLRNKYKHLNVKIERKFDESCPEIEGNFANLGQVFINIIKNALQALPESGGRIDLITRNDEFNKTVQIKCRDNGSGIADHYQQKIFEPFFTTKNVGDGTGLGLYISHEIIRRHNGAIHISSKEGIGTDVTVELPI
ncbi:MAG: ATP-binding protein, partial [Syntrophales bacterium]|nr:ATP-binding protein [Syntrophales bacterium]